MSEQYHTNSVTDLVLAFCLISERHHGAYRLVRRNNWQLAAIYALPYLVVGVTEASSTYLD